MAVRQYIGARYVAKIYVNSLDPSSADWESGVAYEPLTLVTYNSSSYISRKAVAASVGNPADNPECWAVTGLYNGQIAQLQSDVDALEAQNGSAALTTTAQTLSGAINELNEIYTVLHTASADGTKTYADLLTEIRAVLAPMSDKQRANTALIRGSRLLRIQNLTYMGYSYEGLNGSGLYTENCDCNVSEFYTDIAGVTSNESNTVAADDIILVRFTGNH